MLGNETIDLYNTSITKGSQEQHGTNYQKLGKALMSMDELAVLDGAKCILQVRGERPFLSSKYDITKHKNYKKLADYSNKNMFNVTEHLSTNLSLKANDEYDVFKIDLT